MRGDNHLLALTTTVDDVTKQIKPLFAFPVQACKAVSDDSDARFDVAAPSGAKRRQQYVDAVTGEVVEDADCLRGVRISDDDFREISGEAIEQIEEATKITTMVALGSIDRDLFLDLYADRVDGRYFLQSPPKGGSPKAYRITYEALLAVRKGKKIVTPAKAIVTKRTARTKQKLCVIYADEQLKCLVMLEVKFGAVIRSPDEQVLAPQTADVTAEQVDMLRTLVAGMGSGEDALDAEVDEVVEMRRELIAQAVEGEALSVPTPVASTASSDDLMASLKASLDKVRATA